MIGILNTINSSVIRGGAVSLKPTANFTSNITTVPDEGTVNYTDLSTVPSGAPAITNWSWSFEGGTPLTSTAQNPSVQYNTPGTYQVQLTVTNSEGQSTKTVPAYITVTDSQIVADFTADNQTPTEGNVVNFTDTSYGDTAEAWNWTFPGGTPGTSTLQNPTVQYDTPGTYDVTLEVFDETGSNTTTKVGFIDVQVVPVVADFTASTTTPTEGDSIDFTDTSTGTPTSWSWTFAGGTPSTSTSQNPTGIQYATAGNYSVTLQASKTGSTDTETKTNYIQVQPSAVTRQVTTFEWDFSGYTQDDNNTVDSFEWNFSGYSIDKQV